MLQKISKTNFIKRLLFLLGLILITSIFSCDSIVDDDQPETDDSDETPSPLVGMIFSTKTDAGFFDAPFPVPHMKRENGTIRYDIFPNLSDNPIAQIYIDQADSETKGFSRAGAIYLPFSGPIKASCLPGSVWESMNDEATVYLVNVDKNSDKYGQRIPIYTRWNRVSTDFLPKNLLMILPFQGASLSPDSWYAALVSTDMKDRWGKELVPPDAIVKMRKGDVPFGGYGAVDFAAFKHLWEYCDDFEIDKNEIAAATVFKTGEFVNEMKTLAKSCANLPDPIPYEISILEEYENYYVIKGKMIMPIWQDGYRPYWFSGGKIHFEDGEPVLQWEEEIRFAVSVPKKPMPEAGYPLLFYSNGQGGSYTQVFDRASAGSNAYVSGEGPGKQLANRGVACLDIEAATVGPRHPTGSTEGIAFFNFINLVALRDNIRQAASEFTMLVKMARHLRIPASIVPDAQIDGNEVYFDDENYFFWGHSTGASIGDLVLAVEENFRAGMVSGAGVSWIYNAVYKQEPIPIGPIFQVLTGIEQLDAFHPLATMFQNVCDPAEAAYFSSHWIADPIVANRPLDVLILMGIYDGYFPPLMIDGLIASSKVDLAGDVLYEPTLETLEFSGRSAIPLPVEDNYKSGNTYATAVALQYQTPAGIDGHYAPFYLDEAKYAYSCFFGSLATTGTATVPTPNKDSFAPCGYE